MGRLFTALYCTKTALSKFKYPQKSGVFAFSNNVGYQNFKPTTGGNTFTVATFKQVGVEKENMTVSAFTPASEDRSTGWQFRSDYLVLLNANGTQNTAKKYTYANDGWVAVLTSKGLTKKGWYLFSDVSGKTTFTGIEPHNDDVIPYGTAVMMFTAKANNNVTFSGEVLAGDVEIPLTQGGNTFTGFALPMDTTLDKINMKDQVRTTGFKFRSDYIACLNANGTINTAKKWTYANDGWVAALTSKGLTQKGWYLFSDVAGKTTFTGIEPKTDAITAGTVFCCFTSMANQKLVLPAAVSAE